jgi:predicted DNA-binding transcriptional regulator AlpA
MRTKAPAQDLRSHYLAIAESLPAGTLLPVPRELLLELCANGSAPSIAEPTERMFTVEEVAELLGTTVRWVYNHADQLGGKRLSKRCLRFPESSIRRSM